MLALLGMCDVSSDNGATVSYVHARLVYRNIETTHDRFQCVFR